MRAVTDVGQANVAYVLQAGPSRAPDEPVGGLDRDLAVVDAVDQEERGVSGVI